jgi:hypothetical protein
MTGTALPATVASAIGKKPENILGQPGESATGHCRMIPASPDAGEKNSPEWMPSCRRIAGSKLFVDLTTAIP